MPSTANEFNSLKVGTCFEEKSYSEFKNERLEIINSNLNKDVLTIERFTPIWINSLKQKLNISNNTLEYSIVCNKSDLKIIQKFLSQKNLEWIKTNIRGHLYLNFTRSKAIDYRTYVQELSQTSFSDIIDFFDSIPYFLRRKK